MSGTAKDNEKAAFALDDQDDGVTRMEALYFVFGKGWKMVLLWASIGLIAYVQSLSQSTTGVYLQFATSAFASHATLGTIGVINGLVSAIAQPIIAKICDLSSRPAAFAAAVVFYVIGSTITAASHTVMEVAAGEIISKIGITGLGLITTIIVADMTNLQNRGLVNSIKDSPYIVNAFVAGFITQGISAFSENGWRWGYGMFIILVPVCVAPALVVLFWADRKARRLGALSLASSSYARRQLLKRSEIKRTRLEMVVHYFNRMDIVGLTLLAVSFGLLLVPATVSRTMEGGYSNPSIIAMFCVGGVLWFVFVGWEWMFAKYPIMPKRVLNRSLICSCAIQFFLFLSSAVYNTYWLSWVYVIKDWSDRNYTFFSNISTVGLCVFGLLAGALFRFTHRYKWVQYVGLCLRLVAMGLVFRSSVDPSDSILVISQILDAAGGGLAMVGSLVATQASVPHQDTALVIALLNLWAITGGSIGSAVGASIWTQQLPLALDRFLGSTLNATEIADIYGSVLVARMAEPRDLVIAAYLQAGHYIFLAALVLTSVSLIPGLLTANFYLDTRHNTIESKKVIIRSEEETDGTVIKDNVAAAEELAKRELGLRA